MSAASDINAFDGIVERLAKRVYELKESGEPIPRELYQRSAEELMKAIYEGLGGSQFSFSDPRNSLLPYLQDNIFKFSGAKSTAELIHFNSLLYDSSGNLRSFTEFRNACFDANLTFNVSWLQTEYNTAVAGAQTAVLWENVQNAEAITYRTVGDDRVRPEHAELDGFTAPPSDPVWDIIFPPNDWNCRCTAIPGILRDIIDGKLTIERAKELIPVYFQRNTGTSKIVLPEDGYLQYQPVNAASRVLQAERDYGMQSIDHIYQVNQFTPELQVDNAKQAINWYNDAKGPAAALYERDVTGVMIKIEEQAINQLSSENFNVIPNIPDVLKKPDEVWSNRTDNSLERYYIKFFADVPIVVTVSDDQGMTLVTAYESSRLKKIRRNVLIYRK